MRQTWIRGSQAVLLVYSIISRRSFEELSRFYNLVLEAKDDVSFPMVLVGNKSDLPDQREVDIKEGQYLAESWGIPFFETSAKTNVNVTECFYQCVREIRNGGGLGKLQKLKKRRDGLSLLNSRTMRRNLTTEICTLEEKLQKSETRRLKYKLEQDLKTIATKQPQPQIIKILPHSIVNDYEKLFNDSNSADVIVEVSNIQNDPNSLIEKIYVHSIVLAARAPKILKCAINTNGKQKVISITTKYSLETVKTCLEFLYRPGAIKPAFGGKKGTNSNDYYDSLHQFATEWEIHQIWVRKAKFSSRVGENEVDMGYEFGKLQNDRTDLADLKLVLGNDSFLVHSFVLVNRCGFFRGLFTHQWKETISTNNNSTGKEEIPIFELNKQDFDSKEMFSLFLEFLYSDDVKFDPKNPISTDILTSLLVSANQFSLPRLRSICELALQSRLTRDNALDLYFGSVLNGANQLQMKSAFELSQLNCFELVSKRPEFNEQQMPDWKYIHTTHSILVDLDKSKKEIELKLKNIDSEGEKVWKEILEKQYPKGQQQHRRSFISRLFNQ